MLAEIKKIEGNIELIENSGIQFVDYEKTVDWSNLNDHEAEKHSEGRFLKVGSEEPLLRLIPRDVGDDVKYCRGLSPEEDLSDLKRNDLLRGTKEYLMSDSLKLYDGVWFPLPFFSKNPGLQGHGPWNWARCRIVDVTDKLKAPGTDAEAQKPAKPQKLSAYDVLMARQSGGNAQGPRTYRIVLAFDTKIQRDSTPYFAPTSLDVISGTVFEICKSTPLLSAFLKPQQSGNAWVEEWIAAVFTKLGKERLDLEEGTEDPLKDKEHQAHYLNVLSFVSSVVRVDPVRFIANSQASQANAAHLDVDLVLDIGNSRSCGILVEHIKGSSSADDFGNIKMNVLSLRDLNAPEEVYTEPFFSRVEFSRACFEFDGKSSRSGRLDAFTWPSFARVGNEALKLFSHRQGNEGQMGISSPKRYLWSFKNENGQRWNFNSYSYQVKSEILSEEFKTIHSRVYDLPVGKYINANGDALFALKRGDNTYCSESTFSWRSTMTFMLLEVFLQALVHMNSVARRSGLPNSHVPRRLKSIILTVPPAMSLSERESLRSCVYEALGLLWKGMEYDLSPREVFRFNEKDQKIYPPVPKIYMDWNEAESCQVVYLYNEMQKVYDGSGKRFIASLRREGLAERRRAQSKDSFTVKQKGAGRTDEEHKLISTRIATIDIGGGTTDMVVRDYAVMADLPDHEADVKPYEVLSDGARIAGDDIVLDLIKKGPLKAVREVIRAAGVNDTDVLRPLLGRSNASAQEDVMREQFVQQILVPTALRIMFHVEQLSETDSSCIVEGTIADFLKGQEHNEHLDPNVKKPKPHGLPEPETIAWFDEALRRGGVKNFSILDVRLMVDVGSLNADLAAGRGFDICQVLNRMAEILSLYDVDLLLLTGRPSKLPGVREFFLQRLALSPARVIAMHNYECYNWYPFESVGGRIGDPKTTASVGALLSYLRLDSNNFPNFRYNSKPQAQSNQMHYIGVLDNDARISKEAVLFAYADKNESGTALREKLQNLSAEDFIEPLSYDGKVGFKEIERRLRLAVDIGCRQFSDPDLEAMPLYRLEVISDLSEHPDMKRVAALGQQNNEELFTAGLEEGIRKGCIAKLDALQAQFETQCAAVKPAIISQLNAQAAEEVRASHANDKLGFFDKLRAGKREAEIAAEIAARQAALLPTAEAMAQEKIAALEYGYQNQRQDLLQLAFAEHKQAVEERTKSDFEQVQELLRERTLFNVKLKLKIIKPFTFEMSGLSDEDYVKALQQESDPNAVHPYAYIAAQLGDNYPDLIGFELVSVKDVAGSDFDYKDFFKLSLKTVLNPRYWTDSGCIL